MAVLHLRTLVLDNEITDYVIPMETTGSTWGHFKGNDDIRRNFFRGQSLVWTADITHVDFDHRILRSRLPLGSARAQYGKITNLYPEYDVRQLQIDVEIHEEFWNGPVLEGKLIPVKFDKRPPGIEKSEIAITGFYTMDHDDDNDDDENDEMKKYEPEEKYYVLSQDASSLSVIGPTKTCDK
jgi:hypothetical protein